MIFGVSMRTRGVSVPYDPSETNVDRCSNEVAGAISNSGHEQALLTSSQMVPPGHDSIDIFSPSHMMKPRFEIPKLNVPSKPRHGLDWACEVEKPYENPPWKMQMYERAAPGRKDWQKPSPHGD